MLRKISANCDSDSTEPSPALRCAKKFDLRLRLSQALHCAALRKKSTTCFARERSRLHRPRGRAKFNAALRKKSANCNRVELHAALRKKSANRDCDRSMLCAALRKMSANCACVRDEAELCAALRKTST